MMEMAVDDPHGFIRKGRAWLAFSKIAGWPPYQAAFTRPMNPPSSRRSHTLQNEPAQIGVRREVADVALDKIRIDAHFFAVPVGGGKADLIQHALHHRLQPARANIFDGSIDLGGKASDRRYRVVGKFESRPSGCISATYCLIRLASVAVGV